MTNSMVHDCPHCSTPKMAFTIRGEYADPTNPSRHFVTGSCNGCSAPLVALLVARGGGLGWTISNFHGDILQHTGLNFMGAWPEAQTLEAPNNTPEKVGRSYVEAAEARKRKSWNAACGTYRRTMELALKAFAPDIEAWKLEKRIDKLASEGLITSDIQTWAHELRLDGNEALHGDEDATEEMTEQMHHLTHFLLVYLYTLPGQIKAARDRRGA